MTLETNCLNNSLLSAILTVSIVENRSTTPIHSTYHTHNRALSSVISSSWAQLTFSTENVRSFLHDITSDQSWDISTIVALKPVTSTLIYSSIALFSFLTFSSILCGVSCSNCCGRKSIQKNQSKKKWKSYGPCVCVLLLIIIVLAIIGQMIYISYQVSKTKILLDNLIIEVNQEIYPNEISEHLKHMSQQFKDLDTYTIGSDSILIDASRAIVLKTFQKILDDKYFFNKILSLAMNTRSSINSLEILIDNQNLPVMMVWNETKNDNKQLFDGLEKPLQQLCTYSNESDLDIDKFIVDALHRVHEALSKLINTIDDDLLTHMNPLIDTTLEDQIRWYIRMITIILLVLIIVIGIVPVTFYTLIALSNRCCYCRQIDSSARYRYQTEIDTDSFEGEQKSGSNIVLCCTRIFITPIVVLVMLVIFISGLLYGIDLVNQGVCRTLHDDQSFLVPFLVDEILGPNANDLIVDGDDMNKTILTVIEDCIDERHFTDQYFKNQLDQLDISINQIMSGLNTKVHDQFKKSIDTIAINSSIERLNNLSSIANSATVSNATYLIENDLKEIRTYFDKISLDTSPLSNDTIGGTIQNFKNFSKQVLESTIDACPLPLKIFYKADAYICHDFAMYIGGLWLSIFIYVFLIVVGLSTCGLCYYKRIQTTNPPIPPMTPSIIYF